MNSIEKIELLEHLIQQSSSVKVEKIDNPDFVSWKHNVERTLIKIFGEKSLEYSTFKKLKFCYQAKVYREGFDHTSENLECFRRDFKILINLINQYIAEFKPTNNNG